LLYPTDLKAVSNALQHANGDELPRGRVEDAISRIAAAAEHAQSPNGGRWGRTEDRAWALELAQRTIRQVRGEAVVGEAINLYVVDDDVGGPYPPPPRTHFTDGLRAAGFEVRETKEAANDSVVAVYCDIRAWKRRPGLSEQSIAAVNEAVARGAALVLLFGHPRLAAQFQGENVVSAWGGEPLMQEAAARWLRGHATN
jgi:hypothetical protein